MKAKGWKNYNIGGAIVMKAKGWLMRRRTIIKEITKVII